MTVGHRPTYRQVAQVLSPGIEDDLLEVGCGSGGLLARHAAHVHRVAGIDLSPVQVRMARRRLARRIADGSAEIVLGDVAALPWPDAWFSAVVWLWGVEVLVGDPHQALTEIRRVLRPDGRAVLSVGAVFEDRKPRGQVRDLPGFWQWTPDRARQQLTQAGFLDPDIRPIQVGVPLVSRVDLALFGFDTIQVAVARPADDAGQRAERAAWRTETTPSPNRGPGTGPPVVTG
jgi:SAM-dependent methyltransferase